MTGASLAPYRVQFSQPGHAGITFTPDGKALVLAAVGEGQREQLFLRPLDGSDEDAIAGTAGGRNPAVSPDGRQVAFTANGSLMTVPLAGGRPVVLAEAPHLHGIAWSRDGRDVYYVPTVTGGLWKVPAAGGTPIQITTPSPREGEISHEWPALSPHGRCLAYVTNAQTRALSESSVFTLDLSTGTRARVVPQALGPQFGPDGDLFFMFRDGDVGVARLSEDCRSLTSEPSALDMRPWLAIGAAFYAVGPHGEIAYVPGPDLSKRTVSLTNGTTNAELSGAAAFHSIGIAPDGRTIAATTIDRTLLVTGIDRAAWTVAAQRISLTPPVWRRDTNTLAFSDTTGRLAALTPPASRGDPLANDPNGNMLYPLTWHPDGGLLVRTLGSNGIWKAADGRLNPMSLASELPVAHADIDPSGELVAFASDYSGRYEVYVQDLLGQEAMTQVSSGAGAMEPHWSRDGRRLYFASGASSVDVAEISRHPPRAAKPTTVSGISNKAVSGGDRFTFAVVPDGRIAYIREAAGAIAPHVHVRQHWRSLLPLARPPGPK